MQRQVCQSDNFVWSRIDCTIMELTAPHMTDTVLMVSVGKRSQASDQVHMLITTCAGDRLLRGVQW